MTAVEATALKEGIHDRLLAQIQFISDMSGVPVRMIKQSSRGTLSDNLIAYLKVFKKAAQLGDADVYLTGKMHKSPETIMMAMAAVMLRNFIDARVIPLQMALDDTAAAGKASCLMIPDFMSSFIGKPMASHQLQVLYGLLLERRLRDKPTVLYIHDMSQLETLYGDSLAEFVTHNFDLLKE